MQNGQTTSRRRTCVLREVVFVHNKNKKESRYFEILFYFRVLRFFYIYFVSFRTQSAHIPSKPGVVPTVSE